MTRCSSMDSLLRWEGVWLCELLAESSPPQCGGASLVVEGLDLGTMEGLTTNQNVTWRRTYIRINDPLAA